MTTTPLDAVVSLWGATRLYECPECNETLEPRGATLVHPLYGYAKGHRRLSACPHAGGRWLMPVHTVRLEPVVEPPAPPPSHP